MVNPADWLKKGVTKLHGWLEKAEREELEQRLDIVKEPEDPRSAPIDADDGQPRLVDLEAATPAEPPPAPKAPIPKTPTPGPAVPPQFASSSYPPPAPRGIAGLTKRESGQSNDDERIVVNDTNDTMYRQRDMLVTAIRERYSGYGPRVATAMLQRALLPNGVEMVLAKLGLKTRGNADRDHDQITDFLEKRGVEPFCEALGIKAESAGVAPRPATGHSGSDSSSQGSRSGTGGDRAPRMDSTDPRDLERRRLNAQLSQNAVEKGASRSIKMQKVNVKPINLGGPASATPPAASQAPASPAAPRVALYPQSTPMPKAHTNAPPEAPVLAQVPAPKPVAFPAQPKAAVPASAIPQPPAAGQDPRATLPSPRPAAFQPWKPSPPPPHMVDTAPTAGEPITPAPAKSAADFLADEMDSDRFPKPG